MKIQAKFLVESIVEIPLDLDLDEFYEWLGDDDVESSPALVREFLESDRDFPHDGIIDSIRATDPTSWAADLMYVVVPDDAH